MLMRTDFPPSLPHSSHPSIHPSTHSLSLSFEMFACVPINGQYHKLLMLKYLPWQHSKCSMRSMFERRGVRRLAIGNALLLWPLHIYIIASLLASHCLSLAWHAELKHCASIYFYQFSNASKHAEAKFECAHFCHVFTARFCLCCRYE